jgi:hypothetical protein
MAAEILMGGPAEEVQQEDEDVTVFADESDVEATEFEDDGGESQDVESEDEIDETDDDDGLAAFAEELGLDADKLALNDDGEIVVSLKVNGKDEKVALKEAISQTQYSKANEEKARNLADERKTFESERAQVSEALSKRMDHLQGLGQMLEQRIMAQFNSIDWDRLRVTDPAEWTAKQHELQKAQQELYQAGSQVGEQYRIAQEEQKRLNDSARQMTLQEQRKLMIESVPEWQDEAKMKEGLGEIIGWAREQGFEDSELSDVVYNRHVQMLRKAMLYDKGQTVASKKVQKQAPKMQRASNGRFVSSKKKSKMNQLIEKAKTAKGANKRNAQHDAVAAILMGD